MAFGEPAVEKPSSGTDPSVSIGAGTPDQRVEGRRVLAVEPPEGGPTDDRGVGVDRERADVEESLAGLQGRTIIIGRHGHLLDRTTSNGQLEGEGRKRVRRGPRDGIRGSRRDQRAEPGCGGPTKPDSHCKDEPERDPDANRSGHLRGDEALARDVVIQDGAVREHDADRVSELRWRGGTEAAEHRWRRDVAEDQDVGDNCVLELG